MTDEVSGMWSICVRIRMVCKQNRITKVIETACARALSDTDAANTIQCRNGEQT